MPFYAGGDCVDAIGLNDPYLASVKREIFIPGHSSGSDTDAIMIANEHPSGIYSAYTYLDPDLIDGTEDISLWVDNQNPQEAAKTYVSEEELHQALAIGDHSIWSIITTPVMIR